MGASAIAGVLVAIPFVGYVVGDRKRKVAWVKLGAVADFAVNQTRLVTFDNPLRQPWDGITSQTGVFVEDPEQIDDARLGELGASGVVKRGRIAQVVMGTQSDRIAARINRLLESE